MDSAHKTSGDYFSSILTAIERPLEFASRNSFANLHTIKGLEELIPSLADKGLAASTQEEQKVFFLNLKAEFLAFTKLTQEQKKNIILNTLARLKAANNSGPRITAPPPSEDSHSILSTPVSSIKGVGTKTAEALSRMHIRTIEDILYLIPRSYVDQRNIVTISQLQPSMHALVIGTVVQTGLATLSGRKKIFDILVSDGTGTLAAKWFHLSMPYVHTLKKTYVKGLKVILSGQVSQFRFSMEMHHPEIELFSDDDSLDHKLMITPVYPLTEGIHQKTLQKIAKHAVAAYVPLLPEYMPEKITAKNNLVSLHEAFQKIHFPDADANLEALLNVTSPWHRRIVFDEFFQLQVMLALKKRGVSIEPGISYSVPEDKLALFLSSLPFMLTAAQRKALHEILTDMQRASPMNRLVQGDVGSGKTVVALIAGLVAVWNGYQCAFMAPTELLAEQHYRTIKSLCGQLDITIVLLTSRQQKSIKDEILLAIREGKAHLIIGTHALIQAGIEFSRLGLAIIDEQHKFGVMQRAEIKKKGTNPDILVMTATPIPRTLGLTVYGDLDISIIDELPPGRKPIATKVFSESRRKDVYDIVRRELKKGSQAFIVYPLVEESEKIDLMDATRMAAHLQQDIFSEYRVGLVHGKMPAAEKDGMMKNFQDGAIHILVATTVVEVGIDVPNASLM
ncbi:MAG: ATP-dependent DNA helicase RecG, partial [Pseudomonadota bacterium]